MGLTSAPCSSSFCLTSGSFRILLISALSLATTFCGVPRGAKKPCHRAMSKPAMPAASATVGTSGALPERWPDRGQRHDGADPNRRGSPVRIVADPSSPGRIDGDFAGLADQKRVAVGRGRRHALGADGAGGAGAVLHPARLAERGAEPVSDG